MGLELTEDQVYYYNTQRHHQPLNEQTKLYTVDQSNLSLGLMTGPLVSTDDKGPAQIERPIIDRLRDGIWICWLYTYLVI